ncbi:MAG TPA: VWD domain-containing protein [Microthrixaceae bacterium]|nr:VWD domain-containing protein [Microthrixaceae bacterium]
MIGVVTACAVLVLGCTTDDATLRPRATTTLAPAPADQPADDLTGEAVGEEGYTDIAAPEWKPTTAAEDLAWREETDGLDAQIAVDAFDLAFGAMPGATERERDEPGSVSATRAWGLIEHFADDLTPEQTRRVAEVRAERGTGTPLPDVAGELPPEWEALADGATAPGEAAPPTPGATTTTARTSSLRNLRAPAAGGLARKAAPDPALQTILNGLMTRIVAGWRTRLGNVGLPSVTVSYATGALKTATGLDAYATATPNGDGCLITIYPLLYEHIVELTPAYVAFVLAHELFHCVEFEWAPGFWMTAPGWVVEGGADFAGYDYYRKRVKVDDQFLAWFEARDAPLSARAYSGAGLWEVAAAEGIDPYSSIKVALRAAGNTEAVLAAAGLNTPQFLLDWPSRTVRSQAYTHPSWSMPWSGIGDGRHENFEKGSTIGLGGTNVHGPANFSHALQAHVFGEGVDIVTVRNKGKHLLSLANDRENLVLGSNETIRLCTDESRCTCPDSDYGDLRFFNSTDVAIGFSASSEAGLATFLAEKFDPKRHCDKRRPRGSSDGDPHLLTMDGIAFDMMSVGEFVLASTPETDDTPAFDLQMRTAAAATPGDRYSLITALAVAYGDDRITLTAADYLSKPDEIVVRHNGDTADIDGGRLGAFTLTRDDERDWTLAAPEGPELKLKYLNGFFVDVAPPEATAARQVAMLGSANGDPLDDVRLSDGTPVNPYDPTEVHGAFADSWRVTPETSRFDYRPGESTDTFTDRSFPDAFAELETDEFIEARRECHQSMGRAATTSELDACAFDVVASGEPTYADAYAEIVEFRDEQRSVEVPPLPDRPTTTRSGGATAPTGTAALTLAGKLAPISDPEPPADAVPQLEGDVDVPDGSLILVSMECPAGTDYVVEVSDPSGVSTGLPLCSNSLGVLDGNDEPHSGETAVWAATGGTYRITLEDLTPTGTTRRAELAVFVDDSPAAAAPSGTTWSGSLSGIGDVATLRIPGGTAWALRHLDPVDVGGHHEHRHPDLRPPRSRDRGPPGAGHRVDHHRPLPRRCGRHVRAAEAMTPDQLAPVRWTQRGSFQIPRLRSRADSANGGPDVIGRRTSRPAVPMPRDSARAPRDDRKGVDGGRR